MITGTVDSRGKFLLPTTSHPDTLTTLVTNILTYSLLQEEMLCVYLAILVEARDDASEVGLRCFVQFRLQTSIN